MLMYEWLAECVSRTTALCKKSLGENVAVEPEATSSELRQCHLVRKHAICCRTVDAEHHTHTYYLGASAGTRDQLGRGQVSWLRLGCVWKLIG